MLKKMIYILLTCTLLGSMVSCNASLEQSVSQEPSQSQSEENSEPVATPEPSSDDTSSGEVESEIPVIEGDESLTHTQALPMPTGEDAFVTAFNENPIDAQYLSENNTGLSTQDQMIIIGQATAHWETQMNYTYTKVLGLLNETDSAQFEIEQQAWIGEVPIYLDQFQQDTSDLGSSGSVEYSYRTMILYRERAIELLSVEYEKNGNIELVSITGEAAG